MYGYLPAVRSVQHSLGFAAALVLIGVGIKLAVASTFGFGAEDIRRFEASPFGSAVDESTPAVFLTWTRGDGIAFYSLAGDLNADGPAQFLPPDPAYRMTRIGYSVAVRAVSYIPGVSIAAGLTLVNLGSIAAMGLLLPPLLARYGDRALLLYLNPAIWLAVAFDTSEALGILLLLAAITFRRWVALASAGLLGITRPSLAVALPSSRLPFATTSIALSAAAGVQIWLSYRNISPTDGAGNLTLPMSGYLRAWATMPAASRIAATMVVAGALVALLWALNSRRHSVGMRCSLLAAGALALMLAPQVVDRPENLLRAAAALPVVLVVAYCETSRSMHHTH